MRLVDSHTGNAARVGDRSGLVVRVVASSSPESLTTVRVLLTADLVRRVLEELHGIQVFVTMAAPDGATPQVLTDQLGRFWIATPTPDTAAPTRAAEIYVTDGGAVAPQGTAACLSVGPVVVPSLAVTTGADPLAVRFALLDSRYDRSLPLTDVILDRSQATVDRWRRRIAGWAEQPPAPLPREPVARCSAAFDDNLDVSGVIRTLTELEEDETVRPGARFETFLHIDRVLALDLSRRLGAAGLADRR
jgi:hypothetical protein